MIKIRRRTCAYCQRIVMQDTCYLINGDVVCPDCLEDYLNEHHNLMLELAIERVEEYHEVFSWHQESSKEDTESHEHED